MKSNEACMHHLKWISERKSKTNSALASEVCTPLEVGAHLRSMGGDYDNLFFGGGFVEARMPYFLSNPARLLR